MIPQIHHHLESFGITVEIDSLTDDVYLYKSTWISIKIGDKFCFRHTNGRILKTLHIKSTCGEK